MKKIIIAVLSVMILTVYYASAYDDIEESVLRMHIIANSDSEEDVKIKLMVRDEILAQLSGELSEQSTIEQILAEIPKIELTANRVLKENETAYRAHIKAEITDIPRKEYDGIVLPKGEYAAIRVILGEGEGENWWCVAYPPLCFTEAVTGELSEEGKKLLYGSMREESYKIITSDIKYELKIAELAEKVIRSIKNL